MLRDLIGAKGCPRCGAIPSMVQLRGELFRCRRCGCAGGPLQYLVATGATAIDAASSLGIRIASPPRVLRALRLAQGLYERTLWSSPPALAYLRTRGITPQTATQFHLGATPSGESLARRLQRQGVEPEDLIGAGLLQRDEGQYAEILRSRLVFPLLSPTGRILGFAGRALSPGRLKYLNTKVSAVGSPRETLFGLPQAIRAIRRERVAWIVEGYIDVLACSQAGLEWVVALGGTRPTMMQALQLRRFTPRVLLLLDGGIPAELVTRAAIPLHRAGLEVLAAFLPAGVDPDALVLKNGGAALQQIAKRARRLEADSWEFQTPRLPNST